MKKIIFAVCLVVAVSLSVYGVAIASQTRVPATVGPSGQTVIIPEHAVEVAPHVFYLGEAIDPADGQMVRGYAFMLTAEAKTDSVNKPAKPVKPAVNTCYGFLASGAKWKTVENWVMNSSNPFAMDEMTVFNLLDRGINKWEDAANGVVGDGYGKNVVGAGSFTTEMLNADETAPDNMNEIYFGELEPGTIGVTIVWGVFGGAPKARELREWDQVYNTYYTWSAEASGVPDKMDFDNIASHELGHTMGLDDLYTDSCGQETMYGYASNGEIKKRDLNAGDIAGIRKLYG